LYEAEAFHLERALIRVYRDDGASLANLTDGGEGVSGRQSTPAQLAALARGRMPGKAKPTDLTKIIAGRKKTAAALSRWMRETEGGKAHVRRLVALRLEKAQYRTLRCICCGVEFQTKSARAKSCGKICQQRYRRANGGN
jgi:hypothetical protein